MFRSPKKILPSLFAVFLRAEIDGGRASEDRMPHSMRG